MKRGDKSPFFWRLFFRGTFVVKKVEREMEGTNCGHVAYLLTHWAKLASQRCAPLMLTLFVSKCQKLSLWKSSLWQEFVKSSVFSVQNAVHVSTKVHSTQKKCQNTRVRVQTNHYSPSPFMPTLFLLAATRKQYVGGVSVPIAKAVCLKWP